MQWRVTCATEAVLQLNPHTALIVERCNGKSDEEQTWALLVRHDNDDCPDIILRTFFIPQHHDVYDAVDVALEWLVFVVVSKVPKP